MAERISLPGGELEEAVLACVWSAEQLTVREIHQRVGEPRGLVYTTVGRVLDRLLAKGLVARVLVGRTHMYRAGAERVVVERAMMRSRVARLLGIDPLPAMAALVDAVEEIDAALLDDLARQIDARRKERGDGA